MSVLLNSDDTEREEHLDYVRELLIVNMERKLTCDDILDILFDSDAEPGSSSDGPLSESNEEAHLPENLAGCDRSEALTIPDNAGPASPSNLDIQSILSTSPGL
ncbi:hypothetical protein G5714_004511 [Onychostoma macrolepis]|uniref:Uncharacterized protein n=1 Tax=Onychostoma macrolepis TaxID=369639 RepID=A0A7J6D4W3_9TELE|nr:hypothetical protein G5714_004511 [Onychostoma macrolepis]